MDDGSLLNFWLLRIERLPTGIIHYFDRNANYLDSVLITELKELIKIEKPPISVNKTRIRWKSDGKRIKGRFNINTYTYPDDEVNNAFWGAVKECFDKREPRVDVQIPGTRTRYNFIVQYLVYENHLPKPATGKTTVDLLAE